MLEIGPRGSDKVRNRAARRWPLAACAVALLASARLLPAADVIAAVEVRGATRTRADVVARELLFAVGDTVDAGRLAESERNLRALLYLGRVRVRSEPAAAGTVRVVVEVDDLYARALSPLLAGDVEEVSYGAVAVDYNLFGTGRSARVTAFDDATSGRRLTGLYGDPRLGGTHLRLAAEAGWADEGHALGLSPAQPFYSLATPWAYGASVSSHAARTRLYDGGRQVALYEDRLDGAAAWLVRSTGGRTKVRPGVQVSYSRHTFDAVAPYGYAPPGRRRVVPQLLLTVWRPRYVTERFLDYLGPDEDLQVGSWATLRAGGASRAFGADRSYPFAALTLAPRGRTGNGWYLLSAIHLSSRWQDGGYADLSTTASLRVYRRLRDWPGHPALALRLDAAALSRPEEAGSQYLLGGDSGLRGYLPRRFDGRRRAVAGVELRPLFVYRSAWALGGALFADVGAAWDADPAPHAGAGAGLRLGLPRIYDTPVVRLDVAHGLRGGVWQLSFGLGQYF